MLTSIVPIIVVKENYLCNHLCSTITLSTDFLLKWLQNKNKNNYDVSIVCFESLNRCPLQTACIIVSVTLQNICLSITYLEMGRFQVCLVTIRIRAFQHLFNVTRFVLLPRAFRVQQIPVAVIVCGLAFLVVAW